MIEKIFSGERLQAILVSHRFNEPGIHFFTEGDLSQQLAYMRHPAGKMITPHVHNSVLREVRYTQEVLFIKAGKLRVDFFSQDRCYLESRIVEAGDIILLIEGGHGFEVLEDLEMYEVKQGPYMGDGDKTRFEGTLPPVLKFGSQNDT
jgi:mannose-6-phosphate isomerase-like protein (cupin superfamily)